MDYWSSYKAPDTWSSGTSFSTVLPTAGVGGCTEAPAPPQRGLSCSAESAPLWFPQKKRLKSMSASTQGSISNKLRFLPKVRLFGDLAIEFRMMSDAKGNPINCHNDLCCFGVFMGQLGVFLEIRFSYPFSKTLDACRARTYNAHPVWQASQAAPIDFSSATQPLSSPKQPSSDKRGRRETPHRHPPPPHPRPAMPGTWLLKQ